MELSDFYLTYQLLYYYESEDDNTKDSFKILISDFPGCFPKIPNTVVDSGNFVEIKTLDPSGIIDLVNDINFRSGTISFGGREISIVRQSAWLNPGEQIEVEGIERCSVTSHQKTDMKYRITVHEFLPGKDDFNMIKGKIQKEVFDIVYLEGWEDFRHKLVSDFAFTLGG